MSIVYFRKKPTPFDRVFQNLITGSALVRRFLSDWGTQFHSKVDLNTYFFVSIIRNQELGCLLRGGVAGCITGLLLRDAESFKGLPGPWMIIDRENKFTLQSLKDTIYCSEHIIKWNCHYERSEAIPEIATSLTLLAMTIPKSEFGLV